MSLRPEPQSRDLHASALGRLGGQARAARLSRKRRREIAEKAAEKRWGRKRTATLRVSEASAEAVRSAILGVVIDELEANGYNGVQLRKVARRARVSLSTIYQIFPTRDELMVSAVEQWMRSRVYADLVPPEPDEPLHSILMRVLRTVFEPWEAHPRLLDAFHLARACPGGGRLAEQGKAIAERLASALPPFADSEYIADIGQIIGNVVYGLIARFTEGQIAMSEILPALERTVFRLTANASSPARSA